MMTKRSRSFEVALSEPPLLQPEAPVQVQTGAGALAVISATTMHRARPGCRITSGSNNE